MRQRLLSLLVHSMAVSPLLAADGRTWVVDAAGGGDFDGIQAAVDVAADGDVVLVLDHVAYGGFSSTAASYPGVVIDGKDLTLVADPGWYWEVAGVTVRNLDPAQLVTLRGIPAAGVVRIEDCAGTVRLEGCTMRLETLALSRARDVSITGCDLFGGVSDGTSELPCVSVDHSVLTIGGSVITGAPGIDTVFSPCQAGRGAAAVHVSGASVVRVEGGLLQGGGGGVSWACGPTFDGTGASCLVVDGSAASVLVRAVQLVPGSPPFAAVSVDAIIGRVFVSREGERKSTPRSVVRASEPFEVRLKGEPGDFAYLLVSPTAERIAFGLEQGDLLVGQPIPGGRRGFGLVPVSGELDMSILLPPVAATRAEIYYVQAALIDPT